jgi:ComEC/Rec2-related protein
MIRNRIKSNKIHLFEAYPALHLLIPYAGGLILGPVVFIGWVLGAALARNASPRKALAHLIPVLMAAAGSLVHLSADPAWLDGTLVDINGLVTDGPWRSEGYQRHDRLRMPGFTVEVSGPWKERITAGDRIRLKARVRFKAFLETRTALIEKSGGVSWPHQAVYNIRRHLWEGLEATMDRQAARLSAALLLGLQCKVPPAVKGIFRNTGTAHLLAVSGLHVALIAGLLIQVLSRLGIRERFWPLASVLSVFCMISGARTPVLRALLVCLLHLLAGRCKRAVDPMGILFNACLVLLIVDPHAIHDLSFQLSFAGYGAILLFFRIRIRRPGRWLKKALVLAGISTASWLGTLPLTLYHFHYLVPLAPLINVAAFPFFSAALLFNALHLAALSLGLGNSLITAWPAETSLGLLLKVLAYLKAVAPPPLPVEGVPAGGVIVFYATMFLIMIRPRGPRRV